MSLLRRLPLTALLLSTALFTSSCTWTQAERILTAIGASCRDPNVPLSGGAAVALGELVKAADASLNGPEDVEPVAKALVVLHGVDAGICAAERLSALFGGPLAAGLHAQGDEGLTLERKRARVAQYLLEPAARARWAAPAR